MFTKNGLVFLFIVLAGIVVTAYVLTIVGGDTLRMSLWSMIDGAFQLVVGIVVLVINFLLMCVLGALWSVAVNRIDKWVEPERSFNWIQKFLMGLPIWVTLGLFQISLFYAVLTNPTAHSFLSSIRFEVGPFETQPPGWVIFGFLAAMVGYALPQIDWSDF